MVYQYFDKYTMEVETSDPTTVSNVPDYFVFGNTYNHWKELDNALTETLADTMTLSIIIPDRPHVVTVQIEEKKFPFVLIHGLPIPMAIFIYWTGAAVADKVPNFDKISVSHFLKRWWFSLPIKDHHRDFPEPTSYYQHEIERFSLKLVQKLFKGKNGKAIQKMLKDIDVEYAESYASPLIHQIDSAPELASASTSTDESERSSVAIASRF